MDIFLYIAGGIAVISSVLAISDSRIVRALLYFIVSLLAVAVTFSLLGAAFAAVLEVIIYAGAIMVLFVFVVMMLGGGAEGEKREKAWLNPRAWIGPTLLAAVLLGELIFILQGSAPLASGGPIDAKQVGMSLFGSYLVAVELASVLLLAGLVAACHLGRKREERKEEMKA